MLFVKVSDTSSLEAVGKMDRTLGIVCGLYFDQFIIVAEYDCLKSILPNIFVF